MKAPQDIILNPVITEASMGNVQQKKYTFRVAKDANKIELLHIELSDRQSFCFLRISPYQQAGG